MRARESELDDVRAAYAASEERANNLLQRLQLSGTELARAEEALRSSQRQARTLKQQLADSGGQIDNLKHAFAALDSHKDTVQVWCHQSQTGVYICICNVPLCPVSAPSPERLCSWQSKWMACEVDVAHDNSDTAKLPPLCRS